MKLKIGNKVIVKAKEYLDYVEEDKKNPSVQKFWESVDGNDPASKAERLAEEELFKARILAKPSPVATITFTDCSCSVWSKILFSDDYTTTIKNEYLQIVPQGKKTSKKKDK